jgi:protoporphyrinogen oxidase
MARIVIIGAGLTGLSAAYHLEQKGFFDYELFEKESISGGLCRSVTKDGFTFDYTGHLLHINDDYFRSFIEKVVGFDQFNVIHRRSFVYSQNTFTKFPYQINLFGLPADTIAECIEGYVTRNRSSKNQKTFMNWTLSNFGAGFARHFFYPYQGKIFAYDVEKLTASWTGRFVPQTSLKQIIQGAVQEAGEEPVGYNAQFFYPKQGGIMAWVHKIADHLIKPIKTEFCVEKIDLKRRIVHFTNGHSERYESLINTMPLDTFLRLTKETSATNLKHALNHLKCNSVVNFNLGINKPNISDKHWVYFPETKYPFYRIGFSHNFASSMAPADCSSLYGEFAHINKSPEWIEQTLATSLAQTKQWLGLDDTDIITQKILNISHAYVIYDAWRDRNLPKLHEQLAELDVHSVGRYGAWKYSSMQEAVLDGKSIAHALIMQPAHRIYESVIPNQIIEPSLRKEESYEKQ